MVRVPPPAVWSGRPGPVLGELVRGPGHGWCAGPAVWVICGGVGAQHVRQCGPHAQDQDREAGHDGGDRPRRPCHPALGQQVIGDLPGHPEREGEDRRPLGEPAGPGAHRMLAGQPRAQGVRGVGLDADREGDGGVQVQGGPDARQRGDQPEPGLLRDSDLAGPHLGRGRRGQDQQRPGRHGPARPAHGRGPARGGRPGGPGRGRTTRGWAIGGVGAARSGGDGSHADHHSSGVARGWGSPVSVASAAATSLTPART
jgi:hypothetical protein